MAGCPESLWAHSEPNTRGNCVYCGTHLGRSNYIGNGRAGRRGSLTDEELDAIDRRAWRDPSSGRVDVPAAQDPLALYDTEEPEW